MHKGWRTNRNRNVACSLVHETESFRANVLKNTSIVAHQTRAQCSFFCARGVLAWRYGAVLWRGVLLRRRKTNANAGATLKLRALLACT